MSKRRIEGFRKAMSKHCKSCSESQIIESGLSIDDGRKTMLDLINRSVVPDGIFASSDRIAIGAIQVLKKHGYRVPEDCRVTI